MMPLSVNHSGGVPAVTISFDLAPGYSLSDAVDGIQQASASNRMPPTVKGSFRAPPAAFQSSTAEYGPAAGHRDRRGLHHPGHSV